MKKKGRMNMNRVGFAAALFLGLLLVLVACAQNIIQNVDATEIVVIQDPFDGELHWHTTAGIKWQGFGKVTTYFKLDMYPFEIPVRFNDGGHGTICGSINYELPVSIDKLSVLHAKYGSQEAIQKQLIETVTNKCVYMSGPLMSSKESYAEKRTSLIWVIEDQIKNGVYRTTQRDEKTRDPLTGQEKTITIVEIVKDANGIELRQEEAVLATYGIKTSNFAVSNLPYEDSVESQIKGQQKINMEVQTAIADAKKAEQNAITMEKQGEAEAMKAKWEQEVIKAREVTKAEQEKQVAETQAQQRKNVADLDVQTAELRKKEQILLGEGESSRKKMVMEADGALTQKLEAWRDVNFRFADALSSVKVPIVPSVQLGASAGGSSTAVQDLMSLIMVKTAKDLALSFAPGVPAPAQ